MMKEITTTITAADGIHVYLPQSNSLDNEFGLLLSKQVVIRIARAIE
jgi:hypothetical protein